MFIYRNNIPMYIMHEICTHLTSSHSVRPSIVCPDV